MSLFKVLHNSLWIEGEPSLFPLPVPATAGGGASSPKEGERGPKEGCGAIPFLLLQFGILFYLL